MVATSLVSIERRPRTGSSLLSNSRRTKIGPNDVLIATAAISIEGGDFINRRLIPPVSRRGLSDTRPRDGSWRSVRTSATAKSGTRSLPSTCRGHTLNFGRYRQTTHGSCHPAWILRLLQPRLSRLVPLTIAFLPKVVFVLVRRFSHTGCVRGRRARSSATRVSSRGTSNCHFQWGAKAAENFVARC